MIKHHPQLALLKSYVAGELPAAVSVMIAAHIEMCPHCEEKVAALTAEAASESFTHAPYVEEQLDIDDMINMITDSDDIDEYKEPQPREMQIADMPYFLPRSLNSLDVSNWSKLGKLSRARVELEDGTLHTSLLHIGAGGSVPQHTHNGFEITLLLEGSFEDEMGTYGRGDFIWLDGKHQHTPVTKEGCLCLTVSSDSLRFTQGLSKLLNPIGKFIY
jgi:putative transcriptional regulator